MNENLNKISDFLSNPKVNIIKWILNILINGSYWVCLYICVFGIIFYILGFNKAGKYATASAIIFFLLQCLKLAL